jgi:alkylhydroperoxidase/carboxymuconolactone decarboxylase family protein YurZ
MRETLEEFKKYREKMNEKILASGNQQIQRFFNLDTRAYEAGALTSKTKELLGLVASVVLRCDDYITYDVIRCVEERVTAGLRRVVEWVFCRWFDYDASPEECNPTTRRVRVSSKG